MNLITDATLDLVTGCTDEELSHAMIEWAHLKQDPADEAEKERANQIMKVLLFEVTLRASLKDSSTLLNLMEK